MGFNPEIRRNIWLEFSPHRLCGMPVILGLVFLVAGNLAKDGAYALLISSYVAYYLLIKIWGGYKAASGVTDEVNGRSWDYQKLSAMSPWELTWGKLFGPTLFTWYGGLIAWAVCLCAQASLMPRAPSLLLNAVLLLLSGLIVHAAALLASLAAVAADAGKNRRMHPLFYLFFGIMLAGYFSSTFGLPGFFPFLAPRYRLQAETAMSWYGHAFPMRAFMTAMGAIVLAWLIAGIYAQMRVQMKMRTGPWLWAAFIIFWSCFFAGFESSPDSPAVIRANIMGGPAHGIGAPQSGPLLLLAFAVSYICVYFSAFQEPWTSIRYRSVILACKGRDYRKAIDLAPRWIISLVICFAAAIVLPLYADRAEIIWLTLATLCFAARDIAILHFFKFSPNNRRPLQSTGLYLTLLYALAPLLLRLLSIPMPLASGFLATPAVTFMWPAGPLPPHSGAVLAFAVVQAIAAAVLAYTRWERYWKTRDVESRVVLERS